MRMKLRMRTVEKKVNTTQFDLHGDSPPMKGFYLNTKVVCSLPFGTEEIILFLSDEPFAEGEVFIAFPPVPFYKELKTTVRYEHRVEIRGKDRRAANTPELPVTLVYVNKSHLEDEFIAAQKPIHLGMSPVGESVEGGEGQPGTNDLDLDSEIVRTDALAVFDAFLRESVRPQEGGRLTSRQIWPLWAERCGNNPDDRVIEGVRYADVARRVRAVFGVTAAKFPTRINGSLQRYWSDYAI